MPVDHLLESPTQELKEEVRFILNAIVDNIPDYVFYLLDICSGHFTYVSHAYEAMTGRNSDQATSLWLDLAVPEHRKRVELDEQRMHKGLATGSEFKILRGDGAAIWIKNQAWPIADADGRVCIYAGMAENITAAKLAKDSLRRTNLKFRRILANVPDITWTADEQGEHTYISPKIKELLGYSPQQCRNEREHHWWRRIHPDDAERVIRSYRALFAERTPFNEEYRLRRKDGGWIWIHDRAIRTHLENGVLYADGIFTDVTARKQAETELKVKTALLEAQTNSTIDGILVVGEHGKIILRNRRFVELFRIPPQLIREHDDEPLLRYAVSLLKDPDAFLAKVNYLYSHPNETSRDEIEFHDGTAFDRYSSPMIGKDGTYYGRIWTFRDITERKRNEDMLRQLSRAVEQSSVSVVITDPRGCVSYVNRKFSECTGYSREEVVGKNPKILKSGNATPEFYRNLWETILKGNEWRGEFQNRKKNGELFWESATISPITDTKGAITHFLAIKEDITERRLLESQLRQSQKLEAIGHLSAGIAHEINTPTQFVTDNLTFLRESWNSVHLLLKAYQDAIAELGPSVPPSVTESLARAEQSCDLPFVRAEVPRALEQALDGMRRVSKIVRAMKEFSHPDSSEKTATDLNRSIESVITVARNEWKYVANVITDFDPALPPIVCYAGEINQVVLNLLVNAAHTVKQKLREGEKGRIAISTRLHDTYAQVAVSDTGTGIPVEIRTRIFDPFFTTKEVGQGTGQGLALAHSVVVNKHRGRIWFDTEMNRGTTFYFELPIDLPEETSSCASD